MTELLRAAYRRALRTRATVYGWSTYARVILDENESPADAPGSCGGHYVAVTPAGIVERYTYNASEPRDIGGYGAWRVTARATLDRAGSVITAEEL